MCTSGLAKDMTRDVLPQDVKPSHYKLEITPGLESLTFSGSVSVTLLVKAATKTIVCNANDLQVQACSVEAAAGVKVPAKSIVVEQEKEIVTFQFEQELIKDTTVTLHVQFTGIHNDKMAGFYRSGYTDQNGEKKFLVVTQFEGISVEFLTLATDCRRCFPSWDEPNLKATFDITLNVPLDRTALSNMNVIEEKKVTIEGKELNCVTFARTPVMSTYLVAMCVGEFDYLEDVAHPKGQATIACRVFTLKGQKEMGRFGLGVCVKTLEFFSEYFDVAYPLPKMDMVAIPDFGAGAMENWGLVTYRETALLYDEAKSSARSKERVAYVVCHELAHQWFGNLVTMDWWSELWLNEGFATFVGWMAVDILFPEWNVFTSFVTGEFTSGVTLDALRSSHAIEVDVKSPAEINQIFDAISYSKGASVIRMLNSFLGGEVFAKGVRAYLKKHAYANAKTTDLWDSLATASGQDVKTMMHSWTRDVGYPMITITSEHCDTEKKEMTLGLSQKRFLSTGDVTAEEETASPNWFVPIGVVTNTSKPSNMAVQKLTEKTGKITFPYAKSEGSFYKLNSDVTGFYRVLYSAEQLESLSLALSKNIASFSTQDRIGIVSDAFAFARAGLGSTVGALEILKGYKDEEDQTVLEEIASKFGSLKAAWYKDKEAVKGFNALQRAIFSPKVQALGYEYPAGENHLDVLKRNLVIACAASANDERFKKYLSGSKEAFHPNLREQVFKTVLKHSKTPEADFGAILSIYKSGITADEKISALACIGAVNDLKIAEKILNEIVMDTDIVKLQVMSLATQCPLKLEVLALLWNWLTKNWDGLHQKLSGTISLLGRVLAYSVNQNIGEKFALEVEAWAEGKDCATPEATALRIKQVTDARRPLDQALEAIRANTKWNEREIAVGQWLAAKA